MCLLELSKTPKTFLDPWPREFLDEILLSGVRVAPRTGPPIVTITFTTIFILTDTQ